jgi:hypothetical protein
MKENDDHRDYPNLVDNFDFALQDVGDCHTFDDPSAIIERAGILVEDYERRPHKLEVSPDSLQNADVA